MSICGTNAGYQRHCVYKTEKCDPCKNAHRAYIKKYQNKNFNVLKEKRKEKYLKNQQHYVKMSREYRKNNPSQSREYQKKYRQSNPESKRSSERRRRANKFNNGFQFYKESEVLDIYGWICHICNRAIDPAASRSAGIGNWELGLHIDHLVPISKGGEDSLYNVRPSHAACNLKKHAKSLSK